ncbi:MAG TPA: hypothetical protein DD435_07705 [Cyanobacteria bacterium UBA8530]|nr:hypothetical protein [Cyanobacteria bacterium UBA8530]
MDVPGSHSMKAAVGEPAGLGLFGLAIVTLVVSSEKLGLTTGLSLLIPWAIFLGAFAQLIACLNDFRRHNIFGATAFGGYAFFWFSMAMVWFIKLGFFGEKIAAGVDSRQLGVVFIGYLIFSLYMTVAAMETNRVLFWILFLIDFLFLGLALNAFNVMPAFTMGLAGWSELGVALLGFYGSAATVLNTHFDQVVLPVGKPFGIFKKA